MQKRNRLFAIPLALLLAAGVMAMMGCGGSADPPSTAPDDQGGDCATCSCDACGCDACECVSTDGDCVSIDSSAGDEVSIREANAADLTAMMQQQIGNVVLVDYWATW